MNSKDKEMMDPKELMVDKNLIERDSEEFYDRDMMKKRKAVVVRDAEESNLEKPHCESKINIGKMTANEVLGDLDLIADNVQHSIQSEGGDVERKEPIEIEDSLKNDSTQIVIPMEVDPVCDLKFNDDVHEDNDAENIPMTPTTIIAYNHPEMNDEYDLESSANNNDSEDPWDVFNGGFVKLLNKDWGKMSTSFMNMSFLMALIGLVLYGVDLGTDINAFYEYMQEEKFVFIDNIHFPILHDKPITHFEAAIQDNVLDPYALDILFMWSNYRSAFNGSHADHWMFSCDHVTDCSRVRFVDLSGKNIEEPLFHQFYGPTKFNNIEVMSFRMRHRYMLSLPRNNSAEDIRMTMYFVETTNNSKNCSVIKCDTAMVWRRQHWALVILGLLFAPGLLGFCQLLMEEKKNRTSVLWYKKVLLLLCFPFLGFFCKFARLLYHDSKEFAIIDYSITAAEVLAESSLQVFIQHFIFLQDRGANRAYAYLAPFLSICTSGASILLFYLKNTIKTTSFRQCRSWRSSKPLQALKSMGKTCAGLIYFVLLLSAADFFLAHCCECSFKDYCLLCAGFILGLGLLRTVILVICNNNSGLARSWHPVYLPLVLGLDSTSYILASPKWLSLRVGLEWTLALTGIIGLSVVSYYKSGQLLMPGLSWIIMFIEDWQNTHQMTWDNSYDVFINRLYGRHHVGIQARIAKCDLL